MENAGRAVADEAIRMSGKKKSVAVFCGKGNNGGDGFVAARHLLTSGIKTDIFLLARLADLRDAAKINLDILLKLNQKVKEIDEEGLHRIKGRILRCGLVIDAIFGVGLTGEVRGVCRKAIDIINTSKGPAVLAVDIPSGLDATTGEILGSCVRADATVTFIAAKRGMTLKDGPRVCGHVVVRDLGFPLENIS
jgi:NAD(P)H-hydrate epimerase